MNNNFRNLGITLLIFFIIGGIINYIFQYIDFVIYMHKAIIYFSFLVGAFLGLRKSKNNGNIDLALNFISLSMFSVVLSLILKDYYAYNPKENVGLISNIFFFLFTPLSLIGIIFILKTYACKSNIKSIIQSLITFGVVYWLITTVIDFSITSLNIIILISISIVTYIITQDRITRGTFLYLTGLIIFGISNIVIIFRTLNESYYTGDISNLMFIISGLILSNSIYKIRENFKN